MGSGEGGCFNGKGKCCCFFFLSEKYAEVLATVFMIGICAGTHFLNIMIHEEIGTFLSTVAYIFDSTVLVSLIVFLVGLFIVNIIKNKILIIKIRLYEVLI
ncbi:hypothetical protein BCR36DRAFT_63090 [Piromyces finnis]|uniref:Uncharacterized protein n=1 Tax=Piromyces finnis TaxID=1754191 RepID=A0A1Y1V8U8_9FUNG|nr:hypothetical protein BCR36DRAFT_63090 [Piromyces finnis]|eukprot:ORX50025.1 hypothetical protein BCR36DRAFT_63090 [Piromyces finnis]